MVDERNPPVNRILDRLHKMRLSKVTCMLINRSTLDSSKPKSEEVVEVEQVGEGQIEDGDDVIDGR